MGVVAAWEFDKKSLIKNWSFGRIEFSMHFDIDGNL